MLVDNIYFEEAAIGSVKWFLIPITDMQICAILVLHCGLEVLFDKKSNMILFWKKYNLFHDTHDKIRIF